MARKAPSKGVPEFLKELKELYISSKDPALKAEALKSLGRVYFVHGAEYFVRERVTKRLKEIANNLGFGIERVTFDKINISDWISSLYDLPMFSSGRLIIASELSDLKEEQLGPLIDYLKNPSPDVVLLILTEKIDKRKKSATEVLKYSKPCEAATPDQNTYSLWIKGFASERGKSIDDKVVEYLKARYGDDAGRIEKEIEKASVYVGTRNIIREDDIEFLATGSAEADIFKLPTFLATKNKKKFMEHLYKLLEFGESPIFITSIVSSRIKKLLMVHDLIKTEPKISDAEIAREISYNPYFVKDLRAELLHYKPQDLAKMYKRCMNIDSRLKSKNSGLNNVLTSGMLKLMERS